MKKVELKKGKITVVITIAIACFALVTVMFMQFKVVNETDITSIETMREEELRTELANWKSKYDETNEKYEETQSKIEEYKQTKQSNEETEKLVDEELTMVNMNLGKTDVEGEGIEIILRETTNEEISPINADDLLVIVNALKLAGAEAISINDERIINMTDIVNINADTDDLFIKINGQRILAPYVIKAIGNINKLRNTMNLENSTISKLRRSGKDIEEKYKAYLKIDEYTVSRGKNKLLQKYVK